MRCNNKGESIALIKRLGLNTVMGQRFTEPDSYQMMKKVGRYVQTNPDIKRWGMRHMKPGGQFLHSLERWEVAPRAAGYDDVLVCESLALPDTKNLVLQGEVQVEGPDLRLLASLNRVGGMSNREAMQYPPIKVDVSLLEGREPGVEGLGRVIDFYFLNEFFGMVLEFTLYDIPVGMNREPLIIWELRNY